MSFPREVTGTLLRMYRSVCGVSWADVMANYWELFVSSPESEEWRYLLTDLIIDPRVTRVRVENLSKNKAFQLVKRTLYSEKNMNSLNVEYFLAMNMQNLDKNG